MIIIYLQKQKALDPKAMQKVNFTWNLHQAAKMIFIIKEGKLIWILGVF